MKLLFVLLLLGCVPDRPEEVIPNPTSSAVPPTSTGQQSPSNIPDSNKQPDGDRNSTSDIPALKSDIEKSTTPKDVVAKVDTLGPRPGESKGPKPSCLEMYVTDTSGNGAMLRKGAGIQYEGLLPPVSEGEVVMATGTEGGWTDVKLGNRLGYVDSRYLSCTKIKIQDQPKPISEGQPDASAKPTTNDSSGAAAGYPGILPLPGARSAGGNKCD